jgi:alkylhydroperoxidase family enzyme
MATTPRVPADALARDPWESRARIQQHLAGIPINIEGGLQVDPVVKELCRMLNAQTQNCVHCSSVRNGIALERGMDEDMVSQVVKFETSDLPDSIKAALRVTRAFITTPQSLTDDDWQEALRHFTEDQLIDIVLFCMHTSVNKVWVTLGTDPGPVDHPLYPTDELFGDSPELRAAITALRDEGLRVEL